MLTIAVNGLEKKLHIGCRTFVSLGEILNLLKSKGGQVQLNGKVIPVQKFSKIMVSSGDTLEFK